MILFERPKLLVGLVLVTVILVRLGGHGERQQSPSTALPTVSPSTAPPTASPTASPVRTRKHTLLIYNRLPKTSSETFMRYFRECATKTGFMGHKDFGLKQKMVSFFDAKETALQVANEARSLLNRGKSKNVLTGHFFWTDLGFLKQEYPGLDIRWINLMREPRARVVSSYNYMRWGRRNDAQRDYYKKTFGDLALDNCTKDTECMFELKFEGNRQTAMLMGDWNARFDVDWARDHYDCLGNMENRSAFVDCFTTKFPEFFSECPFNLDKRVNFNKKKKDTLSNYSSAILDAFTFEDRRTYQLVKDNF